MPEHKTPRELSDFVNRAKNPSPAGSATFIGLRALNIPFQYGILFGGWGAQWIEGKAFFPAQHAFHLAQPSIMDGLREQPYFGALLAVSAAASVKQIVWKGLISEQEMTPADAVKVSAFNTVLDSVNAICALWTSTSMAHSATDIIESPTCLVGLGLCIIGLGTEFVSEVQRKLWKNKSGNSALPYTGGLFSLARHPNYTGYMLWRTGFATMAGGKTWGAIVGAYFWWDFTTRAIPVLDSHCDRTYGTAWLAVKQEVPYKLIPGVY